MSNLADPHPGVGSRRAGDDRELLNRIYATAGLGLTRVDFLHKISGMLISFFGCDHVELWLEEGNRQCRCETSRAVEDPVQFQWISGNKIKTGELSPADSRLEKFCWELLLDRVGPSSASPASSWILNPFPAPEKNPSDTDFSSIALTPLWAGSHKIGLLLLKSTVKDFFAGMDASSRDRMARHLGTAITSQGAQAALLERVKELTCLTHIARLLDRPGAPLEEVLRTIAHSLPPAWQYPEIASARILLDGHPYADSSFLAEGQKQSAPIIIGDKVRGAVEVFYGEDRPELYEGPFLIEERNLLDTIARQIALFIERRKAEEQKALLEEQLRHSDRLATVGQLAAGVAHELNEPLGTILGFAQLAKKHPALPQPAAQDLEKIVAAALHAREVIRKLMLFSRQMPARKSRVDLNQVIEDGLYLFKARCAEQGIDLVLSLFPGLPPIEADPTQLTQVLTNLMVNAVQAMGQGGRLAVQTRAENNGVLWTIEDTGAGMSKEVLKRIFIPFFTTKDVDQGTGLGLAVAHGIVAGHKGSIQVESQIGRGTRFAIHLPGASARQGQEARNEKTDGKREEK